jgi:hypothetical protein
MPAFGGFAGFGAFGGVPAGHFGFPAVTSLAAGAFSFGVGLYPPAFAAPKPEKKKEYGVDYI